MFSVPYFLIFTFLAGLILGIPTVYSKEKWANKYKHYFYGFYAFFLLAGTIIQIYMNSADLNYQALYQRADNDNKTLQGQVRSLSTEGSKKDKLLSGYEKIYSMLPPKIKAQILKKLEADSKPASRFWV
jgi:hypothetical protein